VIRARTIIALAAVGSAACSDPNRVALAECAAGWWTGLQQSCIVACMATPKPAACGYDDCAQVPVLNLRGDRFANGTMAVSYQASTLSFVGAVLEGPYAAAGDTITIDGSTSLGSCTSERLTVGSIVYHRACTSLASALDNARLDGWSPQPVQPCK
jgi:hypothetical protein